MSENLPCPPLTRHLIAVLWPSFIVAGMATALFFATFDPLDLLHLDLSRLGAYSVGFFLFWMTTALSSALTVYFSTPMACKSSSKP